MKRITLLLLGTLATFSSCRHTDSTVKSDAHAQIKYRSGPWLHFFNSSQIKLVTLAGDSPTTENWILEHGVLKTVPGEKIDLRSVQKYRNFEIYFEFALTPGSNSGIKYNVDPDLRNVGPEYQILDDTSHPDALNGPKRKTSAVYDLIPGNFALSKPIGQFNSARIVVMNSRVEHWLNGVLAVRYDIASEKFRQAIAQSKFKKRPKFATHTPSYVLIQHHGEEVHFRMIRIREIF